MKVPEIKESNYRCVPNLFFFIDGLSHYYYNLFFVCQS